MKTSLAEKLPVAILFIGITLNLLWIAALGWVAVSFLVGCSSCG